ncbi:MAG: hypothetical protein LBR79_00110 [Oscillospiraceae bacterium]|jgi:hypothetical protein|nr:hypothetical protein [Oscillospiraceae bacterium]
MKKLLSYIVLFALSVPCFNAMPGEPGIRPKNPGEFRSAYNHYCGFKYSPNAVNRVKVYGTTLQVNLCHLSVHEARIAYYDAMSLFGDEEIEKIEEIEFITGQGIRSPGGIPAIRNMVMKEISNLESERLMGYIKRGNAGRVIVRRIPTIQKPTPAASLQNK